MQIDYQKMKSNSLGRVLDIDNIYTLFDHTLNKEYTTYGESHDFWEFVYVNKGKLYVDTCGMIIEINEGEFILHRPNDYHRHFVLNNSANINIASFNCDYPDLYKISRVALSISPLAQNMIRNIFHIVHFVFERYEPGVGFYKKGERNMLQEQLIRNCLESALISIISDIDGRTLAIEPSNEFEMKNALLVKNVIKFLKEKVNESITIDEICERFHVCKTTLSVNFKEGTSKSVFDYYNHLKIIRSMELLSDKCKNVGEVAVELNYSSSQYFSKMFKKYTGVSPREFQRKISENVDGIKEDYFPR